MNEAEKVAYAFVKAMHIRLNSQGVGDDPLYFAWCLKTALGKSQDCDRNGPSIVAYFTRELSDARVEFKRKGGKVTWMDAPMKLLNPSLRDTKKLAAASHVIQQLTGRSRDSWVSELEAAEHGVAVNV